MFTCSTNLNSCWVDPAKCSLQSFKDTPYLEFIDIIYQVKTAK